jgi:hypothetical protein
MFSYDVIVAPIMLPTEMTVRMELAHDPCHQFVFCADHIYFFALRQRPPIVNTILPLDLSVRLYDHEMPLFSAFYYNNVNNYKNKAA